MKNKDRYFREIVALYDYAVINSIGRYNYCSIKNDNCDIILYNPMRKSSCIFALIKSKAGKCSVIIENITKRKAVRLLKHYGFKVNWDGYNEQIYGDRK